MPSTKARNVLLILSLKTFLSLGLQVAVIGTTGNIGRTAVTQLSKANISTRCLLRHDITLTDNDTNAQKNSVSIAKSLASLPNVSMVQGDITNPESIQTLIQGCDAVLCLQGPPKPSPIKSLIPFLSNPNESSHPYMTNYIGMKNVIDAVKESENPNKRIVRLTGKGEEPFAIFTVLINMLGYLAKAWNYEGEQLLRKSGLKYTIVRPGLLKKDEDYQIPKKGKMIKDQGGDMKVTPVTYSQIANVCIESLNYDNCDMSTLTVMNADEGQGEDDYGILLQQVENDKEGRYPESLLEQHKMGARLGFVGLIAFVLGFANVINKLFVFVSSLLF